MNRKIYSSIIGCVLIICMSCKEASEKSKTTETTEKEIVQDLNSWIELKAEKAFKVEEESSWDFQLNQPGTYNLQIIYDGELDAISSELTVESGDFEITEIPEKIFVIKEGNVQRTVFQFSKNLNYATSGKTALKLTSNSDFNRIRITPNYKNNLGFGSGKYDAEWNKMHNSPEKQKALDWFKDAKYGMFIHWGLYSQAGGIWKGERMEASDNIGPKVSEWLMYKFQIPRDEYAELAKTFNPDQSFAQNIAKLAKDAGMKYVVITTKHHDGFALFNSQSSAYDITDATPYEGDLVKELYDACLAEGLDFGVYYSHGNDWYDGSDGNYANVKKVNDSLGILSHAPGKNLWDPSPNTHAEYIQTKALPQVKELIELLPKLRLVWFDGNGYVNEDQAYEFYKTIYDLNPSIIVNRRVGYNFGDYLDSGDNVIPSSNEKLSKHWETCGTTNNSWAFKSYDHDFKSTQEMLYYLVDIASKGGNYLLNIGPDGEGHVPEQSAVGLREMGAWLNVNGEAIYGTTRWKVTSEGQDETLLEGTGHRAKKGFSRTFSADDFWFTTKENKVYAISFVNPEAEVEIKSLSLANGKINTVRLLGDSSKIDWKQNEQSLKVNLPELNTERQSYVLEITLKNN